MTMRVGDLVLSLRTYRAPNVFNPWGEVDPLDRYRAFAAMDRRTRLYQHFDCTPRFLLVGEAPGYQGCHFSGVPFTNEKLILDGVIPRVQGPQGPSISTRITRREQPWSEPSATIVWRTLHELGIAESTVMWNAFAYHPHEPGNPMSNRAPTKDELLATSDTLKAVVAHFRGARVVAVGKVAAAALATLNVAVDATVRHPSMGGATLFAEGLRRLVV